MKLKSILLTAATTLSLATATKAQVPNYVPTNGLVGWWPFNGNANDESGNNNNGTVNGATLSLDRFGNAGKAYSFNGSSNYIYVPHSPIFNTTEYSISLWFNKTGPGFNSSQDWFLLLRKGTFHPYAITFDGITFKPGGSIYNGSSFREAISTTTAFEQNWYNITITYSSLNNGILKIYTNGILENTTTNVGIANNNSNQINIGGGDFNQVFSYFKGLIDDIGIWNRTLTQQEISNIYSYTPLICSKNTTISPQTISLTTGSTATFTATTSDPNPSYVWQSNFGQGFQALNNFGNYSGVNTASLNIANVQLSEHNQPIRVISTSGNCIDTSNVTIINILDTCITNVAVYDTLFTTVTDTLVINAMITGVNPPNNLNVVKVFPNPANTQITIDYGNFNVMSGYTLNIVNSIGQTVFTTPVNQQSSFINLSSWTGNGIYFVQLIDPQNNTIENRKIVIQ